MEWPKIYDFATSGIVQVVCQTSCFANGIIELSLATIAALSLPFCLNYYTRIIELLYTYND